METASAAAAGGAKRRRGDAEEGRCLGALAEAIPVDRISALPDELRQRILTHLPLKDAIRTGALAVGWRDLWKSRWPHRSSVEVHLGSRTALERELDALAREPRPRRRLERFSLTVDTSTLGCSQFRRFMEHAAECRVEDLHVETHKTTAAYKLHFHLPRSSPLLARLSLRRISVSSLYYKGAQPFHALEVIRLHSVCIPEAAVRKMMAHCPNLRALDLRGCDCGCFFDWGNPMVCPANLRSVTIAECQGHTSLDAVAVPSLRSFSYSGHCRSFSLPGDATLADLYIWLDDSISGSQDICFFNKSLPKDLSGLTVLTICSNVLPAASSLWYEGENVSSLSNLLCFRELQVASSLVDDGSTARKPKLSNLQSLRELQLLMLEMEADNLADIYMFLKTCQCPNLERLFVELPTSDWVCMEASLDDVGEEPPDNGFDNLKIVKVMNFNWRCIEVQLINFLLRKACSLHKLLLVSPNVTPLDTPGVQEADLLLLKEALASGKIMLSESDDAATQPYHSEVFIEA